MMVRLCIARLLAAAGLVVVVSAPAAAQTQAEDVAAMHAATAKYADSQAALDAGYIPDPSGMCVSAAGAGLDPWMGAMGIHYFHPSLLGIDMATPMERLTGTDGAIAWTTPEVLVYEPQDDGTHKLVAVEYLVFEEGWRAANPAGPPTFYDTPFTHMADDPATEPDEAHGFQPHYELHAWTARENPAGMFGEWNAAVFCPAPAADPHAAHTAPAAPAVQE
ncbi:MAG: hypothetical protein ABR559_10360 [Gemmatimonadota bacterium]